MEVTVSDVKNDDYASNAMGECDLSKLLRDELLPGEYPRCSNLDEILVVIVKELIQLKKKVGN